MSSYWILIIFFLIFTLMPKLLFRSVGLKAKGQLSTMQAYHRTAMRLQKSVSGLKAIDMVWVHYIIGSADAAPGVVAIGPDFFRLEPLSGPGLHLPFQEIARFQEVEHPDNRAIYRWNVAGDTLAAHSESNNGPTPFFDLVPHSGETIRLRVLSTNYEVLRGLVG